jgi:hypothetical protein
VRVDEAHESRDVLIPAWSNPDFGAHRNLENSQLDLLLSNLRCPPLPRMFKSRQSPA